MYQYELMLVNKLISSEAVFVFACLLKSDFIDDILSKNRRVCG